MCILALRDDCGLTNLLYHLVGGLGVAIAITFVKFYKDFSKFDQVGAVWLVCTALCDVTIATSLTWYLVRTVLFAYLWGQRSQLRFFQRKHKTGFSQTDDVLNKIIRRKPFHSYLV